MSDIADLLRVVLAPRGYTRLEPLIPARPGDVLQFIATAPSSTTIVTVVGGRVATLEDLTHTEEVSVERAAAGAIMVCLAGMDDLARASPKLSGFEVLSADEFETLLGRAIVEHAVVHSPAPSAPAPAPTVQATACYLKPFYTPLQAAESSLGLLLRVEHVEEELVPYRAFSYSWERLVDGSLNTENVAGTIYVNLSTGATEELEEKGVELSPPEDSRPVGPSIGPEEAETRARHHVVAANSRETRIRSEKGDVLMVEHKKIKPRDDEIKLLAKGTYYVPVYHVTGENGEVRLNGVSGRIIEEKLRRPSHADIEMV